MERDAGSKGLLQKPQYNPIHSLGVEHVAREGEWEWESTKGRVTEFILSDTIRAILTQQHRHLESTWHA